MSKYEKFYIFSTPLAAASSPELFINSVGTFITKSDLGKYMAIFVGYILSNFEFGLLHTLMQLRKSLLMAATRSWNYCWQRSLQYTCCSSLLRTFRRTNRLLGLVARYFSFSEFLLLIKIHLCQYQYYCTLVSRDSLMYGVAVVALIFTLQDGKVMWYEALALVFAYIIYIAVMYWNEIMSHKARTLVAKLRRYWSLLLLLRFCY